MEKELKWTQVIKPQSAWIDLRLGEVWSYRDLLMLFVRRDFVAVYKQTILGPLWFIIQPLLTTTMFIIVFDKVAGIPTDGAPPALFYLSGLVVWNYFSSCLNKTAITFSANSGIFGKVYFPRLIVPLSYMVSGLISFVIQLAMLMLLIGYFYIFFEIDFNLNIYILSIPLCLILVAALALGFGIIISSLTAKYRDLVHLISFGIQLLMYATPVIYPLSFFTGKYKDFILINPLTSIMELFRYSLLGVGDFSIFSIAYSTIFICITLLFGVIIFNRVEKSFMDVI